MYRKIRTILNILLLSGHNYFSIISFWRNKINSNKKIKDNFFWLKFLKIFPHIFLLVKLIGTQAQWNPQSNAWWWSNDAGKMLPEKNCFPSHSSLECLLGVFERYNIFKTFKAVIIKAEAILFDDLLASARGISSLCLEHTIEAGIIWT